MKLFIWDFHGTLEKGTERAVHHITNHILEQQGYAERLDENLLHRLYGKKWYEYFAHLLPHESEKTHIDLQERCIAFDTEHPEIIRNIVKPNSHAVQVLAEIGTQHDQILISNTRPANLTQFLKATDLISFFPEGKYFGANSHHPDAKITKRDIAAEYTADKKFERIIAIGDSPQDMIALPDAIHYLYAHPENPFKEGTATYRIRDLREILREL